MNDNTIIYKNNNNNIQKKIKLFKQNNLINMIILPIQNCLVLIFEKGDLFIIDISFIESNIKFKVNIITKYYFILFIKR
jgi:hypothetical protein